APLGRPPVWARPSAPFPVGPEAGAWLYGDRGCVHEPSPDRAPEPDVTILTACGRVQSIRPASAGYLLFLEEGYSNGAQQVTVRDSASGNVARRLPIGTAAPDWSRYYTVTQLSGSARLAAIDPASGRTLA